MPAPSTISSVLGSGVSGGGFGGCLDNDDDCHSAGDDDS